MKEEYREDLNYIHNLLLPLLSGTHREREKGVRSFLLRYGRDIEKYIRKQLWKAANNNELQYGFIESYFNDIFQNLSIMIFVKKGILKRYGGNSKFTTYVHKAIERLVKKEIKNLRRLHYVYEDIDGMRFRSRMPSMFINFYREINDGNLSHESNPMVNDKILHDSNPILDIIAEQEVNNPEFFLLNKELIEKCSQAYAQALLKISLHNPEDALIFKMCLERVQIKEIANRLNMDANTISKKITRDKYGLRERFREYFTDAITKDYEIDVSTILDKILVIMP